MKKTKIISKGSLLISITTLFLLISCGGDSNEPVGPVDPTDPDALSGVLMIPNANTQQGSPPDPSTESLAPKISNNQTSASVVSDNTLFVPFTLNEEDGGLENFAGYYIQVDGASSYYDIIINETLTNGQIVIPVTIPANVSEGDFCLSYCTYDDQGRVSNVLATCVSVGAIQKCPANLRGNDGLTIASYDLGDMAGNVSIGYDMYFVPDRIDIFYNNVWIGGSGSRLGQNDFPPVSMCYDDINGYVSGSNTIEFDYDPSNSRIVTVYMSGCIGSGTQWDLSVDCPQ